MEDLFNCLDYLHPISAELKNYLAVTGKRRKIAKYEYLLHAGESATKIWFLDKGLVRCFYHRDEKEVTMWFVNGGQLIPSGNIFDDASRPFYLQSLENCSVIYISQAEAVYIAEHFPEAGILKTEITKWYANLLRLRLECTSMQTPKERYLYLLEHFPYLEKRITLEVIASYLAISKRTLIRLMREK